MLRLIKYCNTYSTSGMVKLEGFGHAFCHHSLSVKLFVTLDDIITDFSAGKESIYLKLHFLPSSLLPLVIFNQSVKLKFMHSSFPTFAVE